MAASELVIRVQGQVEEVMAHRVQRALDIAAGGRVQKQYPDVRSRCRQRTEHMPHAQLPQDSPLVGHLEAAVEALPPHDGMQRDQVLEIPLPDDCPTRTDVGELALENISVGRE